MDLNRIRLDMAVDVSTVSTGAVKNKTIKICAVVAFRTIFNLNLLIKY